ncbi:hypothetical protein DVA86_23335 [Streptomyces armeniacus]|uniref:DUF3558 domain-containing protein n=1 Tax=Streptomyces armeniacus TaxID=83291 RepID=A0A345XU26_9ACTN|nr:hypothetical protein [Streptomyces armeniacus]AXK35142.1 hypothetical protein DVA86_23335 [Streptomyces armeniacus]
MRRWTGTLAALAVAAAMAGCSGGDGDGDGGGGGREFTVPAALCGVDVPEKALSPLLPGEGEDVRVGDDRSKRRLCHVSVDDRRVLDVTYSGTGDFHDPMSAGERESLARPRAMADLPFDGKGATGERNAMATARCGGEGPPYLVVDVGVNPEVTADEEQRRADMGRFATAFLESAKKDRGCTA